MSPELATPLTESPSPAPRYFLLCTGLVLVLLAGWTALSPAVAERLFLPLWLLVSQGIFAGSWESARLRRRVWLGQYLRQHSPWHQLLRGGWLMILWHQLLAASLALLLVVKLRLLPGSDWLALVVGTLSLALLSACLARRLSPHVIAGYVDPVVRRLVVLPVSLLLTAALVALALLRSQPYLVGTRWNQAVASVVREIPGESLLSALERLGRAVDITQFWAMQNALQQVEAGALLLVLGWGMLFLLQSAFAWSFIRLLVGVQTLNYWLKRRNDNEHQ